MKSRTFVLFAAVCGIGGAARGDINFTPPTGDHFVPEVPCGHPTDGWTRLMPLHFDTAEELAVVNFDGIADARLAGQFPGTWDYVMDFDMDGALTVNDYIAFDGPAACQHGAFFDMSLSITGGLESGHVFAWLQVFHETGDSGERTWTADPPDASVIDGTNQDSYPFYYNYAGLNSRGRWVDAEDFYDEGNDVYTFSDRPSDRIPDFPAHAGSVSFWTMLASWSGAPASVNSVHIYGAVEWGYRYECVPEPPALLLLSLCTGLALRRRR